MRVIRAAALIYLASAGSAFALAAAEQTKTTRYDLKIDRQTLDVALNELARQTNFQVARFSDPIDGQAIVGPVNGKLTLNEALKSLLGPRGLSFRYVNDRTVAIVKPEASRSSGANDEDYVLLAEADTGQRKREASDAHASGQAVAQSGHPDGLDEIIVTAQRRRESSQDVSVALQVLSGKQLERQAIKQTVDLAALTPGLNMSNTVGGGTPTISIRGVGVGGAAFFANQPNAVAINIDDVYLPSAIMSNFQMFDIERVEVLKGPQGTLYGRNTSAGAINIHSRKPSSTDEGYVQAEYSRWNAIRLEAAFGGPITDSLLYRLSVVDDRSDGNVLNTYSAAPNFGPGKRRTNGVQRSAARFQLQWLADDDRSILLNVHGGVDRSDSFHYQVTGAQLLGNPDPFGKDAACTSQYRPAPGACLTGSQSLAQVDTDGSDFVVNSNLEEPTDVEAFGGSLNMDWRVGDVSLTSITAYDKFTRFYAEDEDGGPLTELHVIFDEDFRHMSQELRLASLPGSRFSWIVGGFASHLSAEMRRHADFTDLLDFGMVYRNKLRETAMAGFFHATYDLSDDVRLIAGSRYNYEKKKIVVTSANVAGNAVWLSFDDILGYRTNGERREKSWNNLSGKIGLEYRPAAGVLLYGHWSRGFKSGGFPGTIGVTPQRLLPYNPEIVDAWEVGTKANFADGRGYINLAGFYLDYKDKVETAAQDEDGSFFDFTNAASARIRGAEVQFMYNTDVAGGIRFEGGLAYLDTKYLDFRTAPDGLDRTGNRLPFAPKLSASLQVGKEVPVSENYALEFSTLLSYTGKQYFDSSNFRADSARDYVLWNGRLALIPNDKGFSGAIVARNILNTTYRAGGSVGVTGNNITFYGPSRSLGVELRYAW